MDDIKIFNGDLSSSILEEIIKTSNFVAIDCETSGLSAVDNRLLTVQLYSSNNIVCIIQIAPNYAANNLIKLLRNKDIIKVFHHAIFDVKFLQNTFQVFDISNIRCTKISYKLINGTTVSSSLKKLLKEYMNVEIDKTMQTSNWSNQVLSNEQLEYAVNDVKYLINLWLLLEEELKSNNLYEIAIKCFEFIPTESYLQLTGQVKLFYY